MKFDDIFKAYKRFLKEEGVFKRAFELHSNGAFGEEGIKRKLLSRRPCDWIQDSYAFCGWYDTPEGVCLWWPLCLLWKIECYENRFFVNGPHGYLDNLIYDIRNGVSYYLTWGVGKLNFDKYSDRLEKYISKKNKLYEKY